MGVVGALVVTLRLKPLLGESISPLFFAAVMLSAWYGGLGPGLLATALAGWASAYFFPDNPPGAAVFSWDDGIRLAVFLMVAALISSLTSLRQRAQEALQQSLAEAGPGAIPVVKKSHRLQGAQAIVRQQSQVTCFLQVELYALGNELVVIDYENLDLFTGHG